MNEERLLVISPNAFTNHYEEEDGDIIYYFDKKKINKNHYLKDWKLVARSIMVNSSPTILVIWDKCSLFLQ